MGVAGPLEGPSDKEGGGVLLPSSVDEMGAEATIRFLKAKLRVMQEEMDRLCDEINTKVRTYVRKGRVGPQFSEHIGTGGIRYTK